MTAERYYVRRASGKIFGPFDKNAIQMMVRANKLDLSAEVSRDKEQWQHVSEIPDLGNASAPGPINRTVAGGWSPGGDLPTPVSHQDLPRPMGSNLPRPAGISDLPRPVSALPTPASIGLPQPVSSLPRPAEAGLPAPSDPLPTPGVPLPVSGAPLPSPSHALPAPGASLPAPGTSLPSPSHALPAPGASLPAPGTSLPVSGASLPIAGAALPAPGTSLPAPGTSLPAPGTSLPVAGAALPFGARQGTGRNQGPREDDFLLDEEDLFGSPMGERREDEDDLFGGGFSDPEDDLFGPSEGEAVLGGEQDDLFGRPEGGGFMGNAPPAEEDLFGEPGGSFGDDDLFGPSAGSHASIGQEDDLFGEVEGDDFLGGDQGFSFLDDGRPQAPQATAPPSGVGGGASWGEDLLGGAEGGGALAAGASQGWEDDLLGGGGPAALHTAAPPAAAAATPRREEAQGPRQPASKGVSPVAKAPEPVAKPSATGSGDKKRGRAALFAVPLILLVLAGGGVALYQYMVEHGTKAPVDDVETQRTLRVEFPQLYLANYGELRDYISQSKKANVTAATQAKLLFAQALMIAFYEDEEAKASAPKRAEMVAKDPSPEAKVSLGAYKVAQGQSDQALALLEPLADQPGDVGLIANVFLGIDALKGAGDLGVGSLETAAPAQPAALGGGLVTEDMGGGDMGETVAAAAAAAPTPRSVVYLTKAKAIQMELPTYWLGRASETQGDLKAAIAQMEVVKTAAESFVPPYVALGRMHYAQGNLNKAAEHIEAVLGPYNALAHPREKAEMLHTMGLVYSARNQSELAIDQFTKALEADSSRTDTLRALAEEYERAKKYREALTFFKTNTTLAQSDPNVMLGIVRAHIGLKEWVEAMEQLREGEKQFPKDPNFPYYLGELERRRGANYEAQKALKRAVEIDPSLLMAHAQLAQLAWKVDQDPIQGEAHIKEIVARPGQIDASVSSEVANFYAESGSPELAIQWYREALVRDPNFWRARLPLSRLLLEQGDTQEALGLLERARDEGVQDMRLSAYLADAYRQSKQYDRAIDEINQVLEKVPEKRKNDRADYIFIRGRVHFDRGNYDTAFTDFQKAYTLNPRYQDANFYIGRTKLMQGDAEMAIRIFRNVIDLKPSKGEYRFYMGVVLEKQQRFSQALDEYRRVTEKDPRYALAHPEVYVIRGKLLSKLGYTKQGKQDVLRALEIAPSNMDALVAIGEVEFDEKSYDKAIAHFDKALSRDPKIPSAQYKMGMSHIFLDQLVPGAQHLQLAIKHGFKDPEVFRTLGYTYKQLGNKDQAKLAFELFLERALTDEIPQGTIKEVRRQLEAL